MARPGTPSWPQSIPTIPFGSADAPEGEHLYREADAAQRSAASAMRQVHTSLQSCVKISLTAGGAQRTVETGRMAAPQEPCPLPGGARLTGIESRDGESRRMAMRHGRGRGAEEKVRGAEPSGGFAARRRKRAGRGYMLPFARVEHGLPLRQRSLPPMPE